MYRGDTVPGHFIQCELKRQFQLLVCTFGNDRSERLHGGVHKDSRCIAAMIAVNQAPAGIGSLSANTEPFHRFTVCPGGMAIYPCKIDRPVGYDAIQISSCGKLIHTPQFLIPPPPGNPLPFRMSFCELLQNTENLFKTPYTGQVHIQLTDAQSHDVCIRLNDTRKKSSTTAISQASNGRIIFFLYIS